MKSVFLLMFLFLMSGCVYNDSLSNKPSNMVKMVDDKDMTTYFSISPVSAYKNNIYLRQFYMVNNYKKESVISKKKNMSIRSSRAINVVNCDRNQFAVFERTYFSELYAKGIIISKRNSVAQWRDFPQDSIMGIIRDIVCDIEPSHLDPAPEKDTQIPLF